MLRQFCKIACNSKSRSLLKGIYSVFLYCHYCKFAGHVTAGILFSLTQSLNYYNSTIICIAS